MANKQKIIQKQKERRTHRVRTKLQDTALRVRLSVFRSAKHIYVQLIDDVQGKTLASANDSEVKKGGTKVEIAGRVGEMIGKKATELKITDVVFDRGPYKYHGRVKSLAEGARKGGLVF